METADMQAVGAHIKDLQRHIAIIKALEEPDRINIARQLLLILNEIDVIDYHDQNRLFSLAEREFNMHILRPNFYSPLPTTKELSESVWSDRVDSPGIDFNDKQQVQLLDTFVREYKSEYDQFPDKLASDANNSFFLSNSNFGSVDAEICYCMIRKFKPKRIIEIGSGYSTLLAAMAIQKNRIEDPTYSCELTAIEPYPQAFLKAGFEGLTKLIQKKVQEVPISFFEQLQENDILFIDSSHVLKIGSDVEYEFLEVIPHITKGVLIHIHDIFLPHQYPKVWVVQNHRFWNEQYFLQAFLLFNETFRVIWGSAYMQIKHGNSLIRAFDSFRRSMRGGGSLWLQRVK